MDDWGYSHVLGNLGARIGTQFTLNRGSRAQTGSIGPELRLSIVMWLPQKLDGL